MLVISCSRYSFEAKKWTVNWFIDLLIDAIVTPSLSPRPPSLSPPLPPLSLSLYPPPSLPPSPSPPPSLPLCPSLSPNRWKLLVVPDSSLCISIWDTIGSTCFELKNNTKYIIAISTNRETIFRVSGPAFCQKKEKKRKTNWTKNLVLGRHQDISANCRKNLTEAIFHCSSW